MRFSPTGVAAYGLGGVFVDGATPAALAGMTVQLPRWLRTGRIAYVDGGTGAGPWTIKRLALPATITNLDASGASVLGAGLDIWAAWDGSGVRTSYALSLPAAYLLDVSRDGQMAVLDDHALGVGLTVYDEAGTSIYDDATCQPFRGSVRVNDDHLAWQDANGWHLIDLSTGLPPVDAIGKPSFRPRIDGIVSVLPVVISSNLYVVEIGSNVTLRYANQSKGWQLHATPVSSFQPDAMNLSGHVWAGGCVDGAESADSLVVWDATVTGSSTISLEVGTIVGSALVFGSSATVSTVDLPVGPFEGSDLAPAMDVPIRHPVTEVVNKNALITRPWAQWFQFIQKNLVTVAGQVEDTPVPNPRVTAFDQVASTGQPTMQATQGQTTLYLESSDASVGIALNPATNTADLTVEGGSWIPLVDGSEPPNFITDGAGHLILVAYNP